METDSKITIRKKLYNFLNDMQNVHSKEEDLISAIALLLKANEIFDGEYYLLKNKDVAAANIDPAIHYVQYGYKEGRYPSKLCEIDSADTKENKNQDNTGIALAYIISAIIDYYVSKKDNIINNKLFDKVIAGLINEKYNDSYELESRVKFAENEMRKKNYSAALEQWINIIKTCPTETSAYGNAVYIYNIINNEKSKAENICRLAIENGVISEELYTEYAKIAMYKKDYQEVYDRWLDLRNRFGLNDYGKKSLLLLKNLLEYFKKEEYCSGKEILVKYVNNVQKIIDEMYVIGCEQILNEYVSPGSKRVPILGFDSLGDSFFTMSALNYINGKSANLYSLIVPKKSEISKIAEVYIDLYPGTEDYFIFTENNLYHWFNEASKIIQRRYSGKIICVTDEEYSQFFVRKTSDEIRNNLSSFDIVIKDEQYYIDKYDFNPDKTILIIPESNWHKSLPDYFWKMAIDYYSFIGFKVLINSNKAGKYGDKAEYIYPSIIDTICLAKLCKSILAIRTGLSEVLSVITKTPMTMISHEVDFVTDWYPNLDNSDGHLKEYHINSIRTSGFDYLDNHINSLLRPYSNINNINNIEYSSPVQYARLYTSAARENFHIFDEDPVFMEYNKRFCDAYYQQEYKDGRLYFNFSIIPNLEYDIYIGLKNLATNEIEQALYHVGNNAVSFKIDNNGEYSIFVKLFNPVNTNLCARFETDPVSVANTWREQIKLCRNYNDYIDLLALHQDQVIIFISTKDTHIDNSSNIYLGLNRINIFSHPEKYFRSSYIAIIDGGVIKHDMYSRNSELRYQYKWDKNEANIVSNGYNPTYDYAQPISVNINNREYAVNSRGLNIVVWDKWFEKVLDSVVFDTYLPNVLCYKVNENLK